MDRQVDIAIIGAGTAGLSAFREASKYTDNIVLIDDGPLGTTCARVGCMPSKILIHIGNQFHERVHFAKNGIHGADQLRVSIPEALAHVRELRDRFTHGVIKATEALGGRLIREHAEFIDQQTLQVGTGKIIAKSIIIATGSSSVMPDGWNDGSGRILTSDDIFEQVDLKDKLAVIGGGVIGLELGQALSRLGKTVSLYHSHEFLGGITDPVVKDVALATLKAELDLHLNERVDVIPEANQIMIKASKEQHVEQIIVAIGRAPNVGKLQLGKLGIPCDAHGIPEFSDTTMQIKDTTLFITGDACKRRPLLHEAADEGRIAGFNAAHIAEGTKCFVRRTPIRIVFSQPNICGVGQSFKDLEDANIAIGSIDYSDQGRARVDDKNAGLLRIYGDKQTGLLLGAECIAPGGEHLSHLLANAIYAKMTVFDMLQMPFYHPVIEEGMRTALRDLAGHISHSSKPYELAMCDSHAVEPLA